VRFCFDDDQLLLADSTRRFLEARHPLPALRPFLEVEAVVDHGVWREGAALGWTAMLVPTEFGGGSLTEQPLVDLTVVARELGRVLYPGPFIPTNVVADAITRFGTADHRKRFLPSVASGQMPAAWCLTGDGSVDEAAVEVAAQPTQGGFRLHGVARFVHAAATARLFMVAARCDDRTVHLLIPAEAPGIQVRNHAGLDLTRRLAEVRFTDVAVDRSALIGLRDPGRLTLRATELATVLQAAENVGSAEHLFEMTVRYAKDRVQFGRPIGSFQAIKHRLADMFIRLEGMRAAADYAALALNDGLADAHQAVACAGSYVPDTFAHLSGEAVQLHGGIGFTWEHDAHLFVRRAKTDQVLYGDGAWHRERLCQLAESDEPPAEVT
jgi:alkylation response protein AidB-like acyl-CoA dehydrogenase